MLFSDTEFTSLFFKYSLSCQIHNSFKVHILFSFSFPRFTICSLHSLVFIYFSTKTVFEIQGVFFFKFHGVYYFKINVVFFSKFTGSLFQYSWGLFLKIHEAFFYNSGGLFFKIHMVIFFKIHIFQKVLKNISSKIYNLIIMRHFS